MTTAGGDIIFLSIVRAILGTQHNKENKPKPKNKWVAGMCTMCKKDIKTEEQLIIVQGKKYHRSCFACDVCGIQLSEGSACPWEDIFYCKQHYEP